MSRTCFHRVAACVLVAAALLPQSALAWDRLGHALVAALAERQLSPQARDEVAQLLPGVEGQNATEKALRLPPIASWADELRDFPEYRAFAPLHYINFNGECRANPARDCPDGMCVTAAIGKYAKILGDAQKSRTERSEALKFLVHFVGDIHQPLHTGWRTDRGGNLFQVNLSGEGTNLHRIWDHEVLGSAGLSLAQYQEKLLQTPLPPPGVLDPVQWAESACHWTDAEGFYPAKPGKLPKDYLQKHQPLAEAQVRLAAARLAALLEQALGASAKP